MSAYEPRHEVQRPDPWFQGDDAWQGVIGAYLSKRCDMGAISIYEVLRDCEHDEVTRARYLRMARETMP